MKKYRVYIGNMSVCDLSGETKESIEQRVKELINIENIK